MELNRHKFNRQENRYKIKSEITFFCASCIYFHNFLFFRSIRNLFVINEITINEKGFAKSINAHSKFIAEQTNQMLSHYMLLYISNFITRIDTLTNS